MKLDTKLNNYEFKSGIFFIWLMLDHFKWKSILFNIETPSNSIVIFIK